MLHSRARSCRVNPSLSPDKDRKESSKAESSTSKLSESQPGNHWQMLCLQLCQGCHGSVKQQGKLFQGCLTLNVAHVLIAFCRRGRLERHLYLFATLLNRLLILRAPELGLILPAAAGFIAFYSCSFSLQAESPARIQSPAPLLNISCVA